jgi:UDP-N-acetylmuramate--alanine ligase
MHLFAPEDPRPIHFMGIAGAGMSALALMARRRGLTVTGCDTDVSGASDVVAAGATVVAGHDPTHVVGARAVVHTSAVSRDHPELAAARAAGVDVVRRAEALSAAVSGGVVVAVAGTHGKTTTTVMCTEALAAVGQNPTGLAGGRVESWHGNARFGGERLYVVEADEYDRSFLALTPDIAVVNNVESDHMECYGSIGALEDAFAEFAGGSRAKRVLVGADDAGARRIAERLGSTVWRVGLAADADVRIAGVRQEPTRTTAQVTLPGAAPVSLTLRVPGLHNVRNAAMALAVVHALDGDAKVAAAALAEFAGVGRRFDLVGAARGITVVDDYAHHPSEIVATISAARQRYPGARLVAVFQPHLYSRTKLLGSALGIALATADVVVVTDVYAAREQPIPGVGGTVVADAARRAGAPVTWVPARGDVTARVADLVAKGDVVLTLGAGDITRVGPELLAQLKGRAA